MNVLGCAVGPWFFSVSSLPALSCFGSVLDSGVPWLPLF